METAARHIPEDELHAYLDQALSRSQCVEIECHIAVCRQCHAERERVAIVRDRTTALLAMAAPRRIVAPSFEQLKARPAPPPVRRRTSLVQRLALGSGLVAAGLAAAVVSSQLVGPARAPVVSEPVAETQRLPERSLVALGPVSLVATDSSPVAAPVVASKVRSAPQTAGVQLVSSEPVLQVTSLTPEAEPFQLAGMWQSVDLSQAESETAGNLPKIDGLPIIDIQLQRSNGDQRPVVVVVQQHSSGRILRTIEGPMDRVEQLLEGQFTSRAAPVRASVPSMTPPDYLLEGANARRGLRMLTVMGDFPADTLNAIARGIEVRE